jgi:hypothetical protein
LKQSEHFLKTNQNNQYYIYRHIRLDTNTPFYVGKGKESRRSRAHNFTKRNDYWINIYNKTPIEVEIMISDLTEEEAFQKEIEFITLYKSYGWCEANLAAGGLGGSHPAWNKGQSWSNLVKQKIADKLIGTKLSEETKAKLRAKRVGKRSPTLGMKRTSESNLKTSLSMQEYEYYTPKGKFHSPKLASKDFGVCSRTISRWCHENKPGFSLIKL